MPNFYVTYNQTYPHPEKTGTIVVTANSIFDALQYANKALNFNDTGKKVCRITSLEECQTTE